MEDHVVKHPFLHGSRAVIHGLKNADPWNDGLGRRPAQCPDGRRRKRDALERPDLVVSGHHALDHAVANARLDRAQLLRTGDNGNNEQQGQCRTTQVHDGVESFEKIEDQIRTLCCL